jgi:acyl carrier protein
MTDTPSKLASAAAPPSAALREEVLSTVAGILREVIGEAWVREFQIGLETRFSQDLELESIEFVALAEKLQDRYGRRVDFAGWLSRMELDQIIDLRVGQVVEFIAGCLSSSATA